MYVDIPSAKSVNLLALRALPSPYSNSFRAACACGESSLTVVLLHKESKIG
jgi:hypothetical protein